MVFVKQMIMICCEYKMADITIVIIIFVLAILLIFALVLMIYYNIKAFSCITAANIWCWNNQRCINDDGDEENRSAKLYPPKDAGTDYCNDSTKPGCRCKNPEVDGECLCLWKETNDACMGLFCSGENVKNCDL